MTLHPPFTPETARNASRKRHSRGSVPPEVKQKISEAQCRRHARARAELPPLLVGWKVCTRCLERKHYDFSNLPDTFASDYSPLKRTNADGTVTVRPASRCKRCQAEVKAEVWARLPLEVRRKRWKKNEDQRSVEARREYSRLYDENKRRQAGVQPRNFKDGRNRKTPVMVDAAPLSEFLQRMTREPEAAGTGHTDMGTHQLPAISELARAVGVDDKKIGALRAGRQKVVELRTVDMVFTFFDTQHLLALWYPEEAA